MLDKLGKLIPESDGSHRIVVLPENVFDGNVISRASGKALARSLQDMANRKNVHIVYSASESKPVSNNAASSSPLVDMTTRVLRALRLNRAPSGVPNAHLPEAQKTFEQITNSGYFIVPHSRYKVYPKVSTADNGTNLTILDNELIAGNSRDPARTTERVTNLAEHIRAFPRVDIGGRSVEFRVCRDSSPIDWDLHPAHRGKKTDLMLVSAGGLNLSAPQERSIRQKLRSRGVAVILDGDNIAMRFLPKRGAMVQKEMGEMRRPIEGSRIKVTHI